MNPYDEFKTAFKPHHGHFQFRVIAIRTDECSGHVSVPHERHVGPVSPKIRFGLLGRYSESQCYIGTACATLKGGSVQTENSSAFHETQQVLVCSEFLELRAQHFG
jgi:hypothetical protein